MIVTQVFERLRYCFFLTFLFLAAVYPAPLAYAQDTAPVSAAATGGKDDQPYLWKHVAIGAGGFITGYRSDDRGETRVVRTDTYGAYIWQADKGADGRGRWAQLVTSATMPAAYRNSRSLNEGAYEIAVAPNDANRIYIAIKGRVFRSDTAGKKFRDVSDGPHFPIAFNPNGDYRFHGPFMAVSPVNPDLVFLGTPEAGLLRSQDGGNTWNRVDSVPFAKDQDPKKPGLQTPGHVIVFGTDTAGLSVVYVMSPGNGLFISTDGGLGFSPATAARKGPMTFKQGVFDQDGRFFVVDAEQKSVWKYERGDWTDLTANPGIRKESFASITIDRANGHVYAFTLFGKAFVSEDHGASWWTLPMELQVGEGDPPWLKVANQSFVISQIVPDPVLKNRLWASVGTGIYYTDINPAALRLTWTSMSRGIEQLVTNDVYQAPGQAPLFAVWDFGIHRKENLDAFSTGFGPIERMIISAQQVVGTPSDPEFVVTNASDHRQCCSEDGNTIMAGYSEDAGRSWSKFSTLPTPPGTKPDDPWRMAFGMIAVSSTDKNNIVWVPSYNRAPFFTKDRGETWTRIVFPNEHAPFTGSHSAFYLPRRVLVADPVAAATFYLVHSGNPENSQLQGLWVTKDGGASWAMVFKGEIAPVSAYSAKLRAVPGRIGDLFFSSSADTTADTTLKRSKDGGVTWQRLDGIDHVDDIAFGKPLSNKGPPTIFLSGRINGNDGIWRSVDDAGNWLKVGELPDGSLDQITVMGGDPDTFGRIYIGYKGSGWLYGEPSSCSPAPLDLGDEQQCFKIEK